MRRSGTFFAGVTLALAVTLLGCGLWMAFARARDLGHGADALGYDPAQYAVAARELAEHGRLATTFALPIELARHPAPPWPLALVQPGLVLWEAVVLRLAHARTPGQAGFLALLLPFLCYLLAAVTLGVGALTFLWRRSGAAPWLCWLGAFTVAAAFLLDPEAQQLATGGFTELPFTAGLAIAVVLLGCGRPGALGFGVLLGVTGLFRGTMLWLAPILAVGLAFGRGERRVGTFVHCVIGYMLIAAPWWIYKWAAFGTPAWDLSALSVWDGVQGRTWFSLNHLPEIPDVPHGGEAVRLLVAKVGARLPVLLLELARGPRTLWIGALLVAALARPPRPAVDTTAAELEAEEASPPAGAPRAAAAMASILLAAGLLVAALSEPLLRYIMPARVIAEALGLVAVWTLLWRLPEGWAPAPARRVAAVLVGLLALGWGAWQTSQALALTAASAAARGVPSSATLVALAAELDRAAPANEPVMSNLGPSLAWYDRRPIVHLALTPGDLDACRQALPFRMVLLAFRGAERAWPGWDEVVARPLDATHQPEWHVRTVRTWSTPDGFRIVWLELDPLPSPVATMPRRSKLRAG